MSEVDAGVFTHNACPRVFFNRAFLALRDKQQARTITKLDAKKANIYKRSHQWRRK
jgi:hypothetical protein